MFLVVNGKKRVSVSSRRLSNHCKVIIATISEVVLDGVGVSTVYLCICLVSLELYMYTVGSLDFFVLVKIHHFLQEKKTRVSKEWERSSVWQININRTKGWGSRLFSTVLFYMCNMSRFSPDFFCVTQGTERHHIHIHFHTHSRETPKLVIK